MLFLTSSLNLYFFVMFRKLETLDTMTQKIVVRATDDVYQTTRDKLAVKNEESKKYWYGSFLVLTLPVV